MQKEKAVSVLELLVVVAIIVVALTSLLGLAALSIKSSVLVKETGQANSFAQEAMEAVRNFRDGTTWGTDGLGALMTGVSYFPQKTADNPPKWQISSGEETLSSFKRKIVFYNAQRDAYDNIVESGGSADTNTKKVVVTVSWRDRKVEITTYLTNWKQ